MPQIKNIIFDLGGVLFDINYSLTQKAFETLGVKNFDAMYSQAAANQLFQQLETGKISESQFHEQLNKATALNLLPKQINEAWNAMLLGFRYESLNFLRVLSRQYRIFLFSNTNFIHQRKFLEMYQQQQMQEPFHDLFEKLFYSCEIGSRKPDVASYRFVLEQAGIRAADTCFVDDSIQNVEAGKQEGIKSILLKKGEKIEDLIWDE